LTALDDDTPELSLVLACYNEAEHLPESVRQIRETLRGMGLRYELIFIDDCSRDGTPRLIEALCSGESDARCVMHTENVGRGGTVSEGFRLARGRIVGYIDVDLEVHCSFIPLMLAAIGDGNDGANAYRQYDVGLAPAGIMRHVLSRGYRLLFRATFDVPFRDTEAGFKFFLRARILPILDLTHDRGWFWDTEVMVLAHLAGLRVTEVPVRFVRRSDKTSTVRVFRDTGRHLVAALGLRRRLRAEPPRFAP
jgi:glycosyltransferase involved in cell wall biosynthesis